MLKKLLMFLVVVGVSVFCIGFTPKYNVYYVPVVVGQQGTLWEIADHFYSSNDFYPVFTMCFEEYLYKVKHDKKNTQLTANGRQLQPGDILMVPIYKRAR